MLSPLTKRVDYDIKTYKSYRYHVKENPTNYTKINSAVGAVVGTVIPLALIAKKQKTNVFKIKYGIAEMITTSVGSIIGAVIGGMIGDKKENRKQKVHEGVFQFMNAAVPTMITGAFYTLCERTKSLNNIPTKILGTGLCLVGGMFMAAKLSNKINDPQDKIPDRKLTFKDAVANADDALGVLVLAKVPIAQKLQVEKTLPAIYGWCGYRAGISN